MPKAGEKPGKGEYECLVCGFVENLTTDDEPLKECPHDGSIDFRKLVKEKVTPGDHTGGQIA